MKSDESCMPAHHLHHHDAIMTLVRRVQFVDRFDGGVDRCIESECRDCAAHVIVDRLGDSNDPQPALHQLERDSKRTVTTDSDDGIDAETLDVPDEIVGAVGLDVTAIVLPYWKAERIPAIGRPQDCPTEMGDPADRLARHWIDVALPEQAGKSVTDSDDAPAAVARRQDSRPDHCIQTGRVPAPGQKADSHFGNLPLICFSVSDSSHLHGSSLAVNSFAWTRDFSAAPRCFR